MTDNTNMPQDGMSETVKALIKIVNDLEGLINQQRKVLREQGASFPVGVLMGVQQIHTNLDTLANSVDEREVELQRLRALSRTAELVLFRFCPPGPLAR